MLAVAKKVERIALFDNKVHYDTNQPVPLASRKGHLVFNSLINLMIIVRRLVRRPGVVSGKAGKAAVLGE
jgi:hypothetical protein